MNTTTPTATLPVIQVLSEVYSHLTFIFIKNAFILYKSFSNNRDKQNTRNETKHMSDPFE